MEERMLSAPLSQAELRGILRDYIRWTLYAPLPARAGPPALSLPRLDRAAVTDADVYAARPGQDDPRLDEDGRQRPRDFRQIKGMTVLGHGARPSDAIGMQAGQADAWRRYLQDELTTQPTLLQFERDTVLALVQRLSPRHQQAIWDLGHQQAKEAARQHRRSLGAIKSAARGALDQLLSLLYAAGRRAV